MDRREFYKQLMTEYTFDAEKIKRNAKRASARGFRQSFGRLVPLVGAAAITLMVGGYAIMATLGNSPVSVTSDTAGANALERIRTAEQQYLVADTNAADTVMYVSLSSALKLSELKLALSGVCETGEIKINGIYTTDSDSYLTDEELGSYAKNDKAEIAGAKLSAPLSCYIGLSSLSVISLVEFQSETLSDESFRPITLDELAKKTETAEEIIATAETTKTEQTTEAVTTERPAETSKTIGTTAEEVEITVETTTMAKPETLPAIETTSEDTVGGTDAEQLPADATTAGETESNPESTSGIPSVETEAQTSDTAVQEVRTLEFNLDGVRNVKFVTADSFVALLDNEIKLFKIKGGATRSIELTDSAKTVSPYIAGAYSDGSLLTLIGCSTDGIKNSLYIVDGNAGTLTKIDISALTDGSEINYVYLDSATRELLIKTLSLSGVSLYRGISADGNGYTFTKLADFAVPTTILSYSGGKLYCAIENESKTALNVINAADGTISELQTLEKGAVFARSDKLGNFAVTYDTENGKRSKLFIVASETFTKELTVDSVSFGNNTDTAFTDGITYYKLTGGGEPLEVPVDVVRSYFIAAEPSDEYGFYDISGGTVRILIK